MAIQLSPSLVPPEHGARTLEASAATAPRWNYRQELKELYRAGRQPVRLTVPPREFLSVVGSGDPSADPSYGASVAALYQAAYGVRFAAKRAGLVEAPVMPLEGLWWCDEPTPFALQDRSGWQWRMMIPLAPQLVGAQADAVIYAAINTRRERSVEVERFRLDEGDVVQIMHRGPWVEESATLTVLHRHLADNRLVARGHHHEIYLSDPGRTVPARLRTILRQPVVDRARGGH
jgi:hypothetical protein